MIEAETDVYLGENLVKPISGHIKVFVINTTQSDIQITSPLIKHQAFKILKRVESNNRSKKGESENPPKKDPVDRISNLLKTRSLLANKIIEDSDSFYNSPVWIVLKNQTLMETSVGELLSTFAS